MIADLNNPVSVRYTEIALESWSKQDILDIEVIQCYTPDTITDLEPLYNWKPLLHGNAEVTDTSSPSERAGDISHWQLIKKRAESGQGSMLWNTIRIYLMQMSSKDNMISQWKRIIVCEQWYVYVLLFIIKVCCNLYA